LRTEFVPGFYFRFDVKRIACLIRLYIWNRPESKIGVVRELQELTDIFLGRESSFDLKRYAWLFGRRLSCLFGFNFVLFRALNWRQRCAARILRTLRFDVSLDATFDSPKSQSKK
jgi:hypothetical protein